jgi:hypothetical protein
MRSDLRWHKLKPRRYDHQKQDWNAWDIFPNCRVAVVKCPLGYLGHKVYWLNTAVSKWEYGRKYFQVVVRINHAHFVRNRDTGRHVDDVVGHIWVDEKYTIISRRLDYARMPEWLKE